MCGILFSNDEGMEKVRFLRALEMMQHWGPDYIGYARAGASYLGHQRLKILDLVTAVISSFSRDGHYVMVYYGEIHNYQELARENLIEQKTTSDTGVMIELYAKYGAKFLSLLNGMFVLVILDTVTNEVFAARDRLGVKPLYMHRSDGKLILASEIAAVLELSSIDKFDEIGLFQYRKLRAFLNGQTAYNGIEMFPAGHYLLGGKLHRYWHLPEVPQNRRQMRSFAN